MEKKPQESNGYRSIAEEDTTIQTYTCVGKCVETVDRSISESPNSQSGRYLSDGGMRCRYIRTKMVRDSAKEKKKEAASCCGTKR